MCLLFFFLEKNCNFPFNYPLTDMKKHDLSIILLLFYLPFFGQEVEEIDIHSSFLDEIKVIKIYLPYGYDENKQRYPLTLVIDSESLFDSYVASAKLFSENKVVPNQIVIGITHFQGTDKSKQYGFNPVNSFPNENSFNTLGFIKEELMPMMKKKYRITNFKTIVATNLSANFINYFLFDEKPMFNAYVSLNPSLAPSMPNFLTKYSSEIKNNDTYYYLAHGNNTGEKKLASIEIADRGLRSVSNTYFNYLSEDFKKTSNLISIPRSLASAQEFIFSSYSQIDDEEFKRNISFLSPLAAMEYLHYKYENIEYLFGEKLPIRITDFIRLEPIVLDFEDGRHLLEYGELALKTNPKNALGDYYIGQYYEQSREYRVSLKAYKKGYIKIPENSTQSDGFYENIKRIVALQKSERASQN